MPDPVEIADFLSEPERLALLAELEAAASTPSTVTGTSAAAAVDERSRRSRRVEVGEPTRERIRQRLLQLIGPLSEYFGVPITTVEPPQFLRYGVGDFFVPHQDGNTPLIHDHTRHRRISGVIFLSDPGEEPGGGSYGGGELLFHPRGVGVQEPIAASGIPGTLVAFPSETTHEVTPVTHGVRYTIAAFFR